MNMFQSDDLPQPNTVFMATAAALHADADTEKKTVTYYEEEMQKVS